VRYRSHNYSQVREPKLTAFLITRSLLLRRRSGEIIEGKFAFRFPNRHCFAACHRAVFRDLLDSQPRYRWLWRRWVYRCRARVRAI